MRWIIYYFRQCFCKHDWDYSEVTWVQGTNAGRTIVSATCNKCGWHRSYPKFAWD